GSAGMVDRQPPRTPRSCEELEQVDEREQPKGSSHARNPIAEAVNRQPSGPHHSATKRGGDASSSHQARASPAWASVYCPGADTPGSSAAEGDDWSLPARRGDHL